MAPVPADITHAKRVLHKRGIGTGSAVGIGLLCFFAIGFGITLTLYFLHRRRERNKLPPEHRPASYRPFRTNSQKSGLLANQAPSPEDDKSSMFSRDDRSSRLSLYVDTETVDNRRASVDTIPLIPLHVTPAEDVHDPLERSTSVGSGVSRHSLKPSGTMPLEQDLGTQRTRPRSTSTSSTRYYSYEGNSPLSQTDDRTGSVSPPLQIPKIVHTPSD
jgi:hypothetical protein